MVKSMELVKNPNFVHRSGQHVRSRAEIYLIACGIGAGVFLFALGLQWFIYDRLLHEDGIRIVGSLIAAVIATALVSVMGIRAREQKLAEVRRLETIALMNHHIRNALQVIVYSTGASQSAREIRDSVDRIGWALSEVLPHVNDQNQQK